MILERTVDNRRVLIDSLPSGKLEAGNYRLVTEAAPEAEEGQVLCRTLALTIGAGTRAGLQGSASYAGAPKSGIVMNGTTVSRVVASRSADVAEGALVVCPGGWQDYSVHDAREVSVVQDGVDPAEYLGVLGTNGLTAYFGLLDVGQPKAGETVLVSAAAGSVGHIVGQIARIQGCRVVGVAGSEAKCDRLVNELGFDDAVNYKDDGFRAAAKGACDQGVDVYFDNTGGDILGTALRLMNVGGRIACCGVVSQYDTSDPSPGPRGVPGLLVNKRITMRGFLVFDFQDRYEEARTDLRGWMAEGKLTAWVDEVQGLENAPDAFVDLLAGGNTGTRVVRVSDA